MASFQVYTRRVKFWWHLTGAYLRRYQLRIAIFIISCLVLLYTATILAPNITRSNVVTIGFVGSYKITDVPTDALSLVTQPLISENDEGRSIPALATNWTVSEDGKTYIVFLRDNLTWHDGSQVEAKDLSLAISGVQINALNNKTIQFTLPNPISSFPLVLDTPVFKRNSFYGTGDFRIVHISETEQVIKKIDLQPKDDSLPKVEIRFYPTDEQAVNAFRMGEIKVLTSSSLKAVTDWKNINLKKEASKDEIVTVFLNNTDNVLSSKDVRQALSHAVQKENFDGEIANSPISTKNWAYNEAVKKYEYNTARAKELLKNAELKDPKITLSYAPGFNELAERIKEDWQEIGIAVDTKEEKGIPKDFQALLALNKLPKDPDQYALWHSTQTDSNITHYKNVKVDKLLEDARLAKNDDDRKASYLDFQKFLTDDAPAIFLYHPNKYRGTYKNVQELVDKLPLK